MAARYECNLSPEALKKAVDEINEPEDNAVRLEAIDKLRTRFQEEVKDLELIRTDDSFILRFLRVRKYDHDRAFETLINYHRKRTEWKEVFDLVDNPKKMEDILWYGPVVPLKNRAKDRTFVTVGRLGRGYTQSSDILKSIAALVLTMEKLLENEEMQIYGVTVIEDMGSFGMALALQMASYGKQFLHLMQESMPVRIKSLNFINEALVFDAMYAIMSPFMKEKIKKRMQLHGSEFKLLHERINPEDLPPFLGGSGPDLNAVWWKAEIESVLGSGEDTKL